MTHNSRKVVARKGEKVKTFRTVTHAAYFAGYGAASGMSNMLRSNNRVRNGWIFTYKDNLI